MKSDNDISGIVNLPEGAYFDDGILYTKDGKKLPDDLYRTPNGEVILYEGDFDSMFLDE